MKLDAVTLWVKKCDMAGKKGGVTVKVSFDAISMKADIEGDATNAQSNEHRGLDQCCRRSKMCSFRARGAIQRYEKHRQREKVG
jgi:hypothetical protein